MYDNFRSVQSRNALQIDLNHFSMTHLIVFRLEVCVDVAVAVGVFAPFYPILSTVWIRFASRNDLEMFSAILAHVISSQFSTHPLFVGIYWILSKRIDRTILVWNKSTLILSCLTRLFCMHYDSLSIQTYTLLKRRTYVKNKFSFILNYQEHKFGNRM